MKAPQFIYSFSYTEEESNAIRAFLETVIDKGMNTKDQWSNFTNNSLFHEKIRKDIPLLLDMLWRSTKVRKNNIYKPILDVLNETPTWLSELDEDSVINWLKLGASRQNHSLINEMWEKSHEVLENCSPIKKMVLINHFLKMKTIFPSKLRNYLTLYSTSFQDELSRKILTVTDISSGETDKVNANFKKGINQLLNKKVDISYTMRINDSIISALKEIFNDPDDIQFLLKTSLVSQKNLPSYVYWLLAKESFWNQELDVATISELFSKALSSRNNKVMTEMWVLFYKKIWSNITDKAQISLWFEKAFTSTSSEVANWMFNKFIDVVWDKTLSPEIKERWLRKAERTTYKHQFVTGKIIQISNQENLPAEKPKITSRKKTLVNKELAPNPNVNHTLNGFSLNPNFFPNNNPYKSPVLRNIIPIYNTQYTGNFYDPAFLEQFPLISYVPKPQYPGNNGIIPSNNNSNRFFFHNMELNNPYFINHTRILIEDNNLRRLPPNPIFPVSPSDQTLKKEEYIQPQQQYLTEANIHNQTRNYNPFFFDGSNKSANTPPAFHFNSMKP